MKYLILVAIFTLTLLHAYTRVSAQTITPTTSIRDSVKQKVAEEIAEIKKNVTKKAFVGTIATKQDATLTINTLKNESRSAIIAPDATIKLTGGKDGTLKDLKVGDLILAMGDADGQNLLTVKRLLVITKPAADRRQIIHGTVTTTSSTSLVINTGKDTPTTVKVNSDSRFTGKTKLSDIKKDSKVIIITTSTGDFSSPTARRIHLLSQTTPTPTPKSSN